MSLYEKCNQFRESQSSQDLFACLMLEGKKNGTFLEIGGGHPVMGNNTWMLEKTFGFSGVSIDRYDVFLDDAHWAHKPFQEKYADMYNHLNGKLSWEVLREKTKFLWVDALEFDYTSLDQYYDYLQIDIDPPLNSLNALTKIINTVRFAVCTFEHDVYLNTSESIYTRQQSRKLFKDAGYKLVVGNVSNSDSEECPYEDWYIDPNIVSDETIEKYINVTSIDNINFTKDIFKFHA
jgi:hypothetical protein